MTRRLLVHAHCYQPPREEPWLELVPREPSAAPDHDWNVRITRECYAPLGTAPVIDAQGRIRRVVNAWAWLSFDVGPTLVRWLEVAAPAVLEAMVEGDRIAIRRTGHGTAIAAPYHHVILPLASRRDKETEVRWGIRDFRRVFGRDPRGMWLPETAVDEETLDVLAQEGIGFTILAPHQVANPDPAGRPLRWRGANGREITLITYDGGLSHDVAFGDLLRDADRLHTEIRDRRSETGDRRPEIGEDAESPISDLRSPISVIAVDGETFGHHHRFGDLGIAALIDRVAVDESITFVNSEEVAAMAGESQAARLQAPTSWSCAHGVGRWKEDCGCRMDPATSQQWRAPLRRGLEAVSAGLSAAMVRHWPDLADLADEDIWSADPAESSGGLPLVRELERHRLAMFTSCGWFFDDIARIEPKIVLRHAARALDLLPVEDAGPLEAALISALHEARSNDATAGDGADIWLHDIVPGRLAEDQLAAGLLALRRFEREQPIELELPAHDWRFDDDELVLSDRRTGRERRWRGEVTTMGVVASRVRLTRSWSGEELEIDTFDLPAPVRERLATITAAFVLDITLHGGARLALDAGEMSPTDARRAALQGALDMLRSADIVDGGDVVLHAVLDLYALAGDQLTMEERAVIWRSLSRFGPSAERDRLASRLLLVFPDRQ
ncbi:MAG TPA: DUF3536 domain-containing protein [Gemmatimonadales bacterium]|nr:DUF3536 domain-containing protein [Gemmatimonadales bacterium]